jgi:hypothetical protein
MRGQLKDFPRVETGSMRSSWTDTVVLPAELTRAAKEQYLEGRVDDIREVIAYNRAESKLRLH